jgi:LysR family glycine cleavage system transcriptional activator
MPGILPLRALEAFEAAARSGSFVAAANELSVTPAAISQLIRGLEGQVGRKLFHRANRRVMLTEAGVDIYPRLAQAFGELRGVSRELTASDPVTTLVVSVAPSVAMGWLSSRLPRFIRHHGWVDIFLRGEDDPVPFDRELIDLRLSYGPSHYRHHLTEELATDAVYPVCSPDFLAAYDEINQQAGLAGARLVHTDWGPSGASFPSWANWFEKMNIAPRRTAAHGMVANSSMAALDLARGGLGVALTQGLFCADDLEAGALIVVGSALQLANPYCLTVPDRSRHRGVVSAFREWFVGECRNCVESARLRGGISLREGIDD